MSYGLFLSAAGMQANEYRRNVVANNLANSETTGFKRDVAVVPQKNSAVRIGSKSFKTSHTVFDGVVAGLGLFAGPGTAVLGSAGHGQEDCMQLPAGNVQFAGLRGPDGQTDRVEFR